MVETSLSAFQGPVVAIVQARMTSTRLPGKVLADILGRPLLEFMLKRVQRSQLLDEIWVATTRNAADDPVCELCKTLGLPVFRGDEHDVLSRFVEVCEKTDASVIVRLTADCPLADPVIVDEAVAMLLDGNYDYVSNAIQRSFPDGLDVEVFLRSALKATGVHATSAFQREHVTPYMRSGVYPDAGKFSVGHLMAPADFSHLRWTVDTQADLDHIIRLTKLLPADCGWMEVIALLSRRPDLMVRGRQSSLRLRKAVAADSDILFLWVNSADSLAAKIETKDLISRAVHEAWFAGRLNSPSCIIWIAEYNDKPIGQVRAELCAEGVAFVDVFVEADARGHGLALAIIDEMIRELAVIWPMVRLVARVRLENNGSRRLFAKAGFKVIETNSDHLVMSRNLQ
ncbi:GNAT family N-acetyltransferase [Roseobacter sp. HKCCD7870]|uniref:GNAT family N-acetyltransferase n=1 Tax=Roseobacter sp. HKCCD7870 TaxID=3120343 RepID=UPI0030EE9E7B